MEMYQSLGTDTAKFIKLADAEAKLTKAFATYLPSPLNFIFRIFDMNNNKLGVSVQDNHGCHIESEHRGSGFQRLFSIFAQLVCNPPGCPRI